MGADFTSNNTSCLVKGGRFDKVALFNGQHTEVVEYPAFAPPVANLAEDWQGLFVIGFGSNKVSLFDTDDAKVIECPTLASPVANLAINGQRLPVEFGGAGKVSLIQSNLAEFAQDVRYQALRDRPGWR